MAFDVVDLALGEHPSEVIQTLLKISGEYPHIRRITINHKHKARRQETLQSFENIERIADSGLWFGVLEPRQVHNVHIRIIVFDDVGQAGCGDWLVQDQSLFDELLGLVDLAALELLLDQGRA